MVAEGRCSPVQREAVLARWAGWAIPGGWQWGRPIGGALVGGAGPGPWPHHGDGPVQLVGDALGVLHGVGGSAWVGSAATLCPFLCATLGRPPTHSEPRFHPRLMELRTPCLARGRARAMCMAHSKADSSGLLLGLPGKREEWAQGFGVPHHHHVRGPCLRQIGTWGDFGHWRCPVHPRPFCGRRDRGQDGWEGLRGVSSAHGPRDPWSQAAQPPLPPHPPLLWTCTCVVILRLLVASQWFLSDGLPGAQGGEQQG